MTSIEIVKVPPCITQSFTARYGKINEHLDEDTWLSWFGIWTSAWTDAEQYMKTGMVVILPQRKGA